MTVIELFKIIGIGTPVIGVLFSLFKIYTKIEKSEKLTKIGLKANMVMLDHFIGKGEGNGEFKSLRDEVQNILINN